MARWEIWNLILDWFRPEKPLIQGKQGNSISLKTITSLPIQIFQRSIGKHASYNEIDEGPSGIPEFQKFCDSGTCFAIAMWMADGLAWCLPGGRKRIKQEPFSYKTEAGEFIPIQAQFSKIGLQSRRPVVAAFAGFPTGTEILTYTSRQWLEMSYEAGKSLQFWSDLFWRWQRWISALSPNALTSNRLKTRALLRRGLDQDGDLDICVGAQYCLG